MERDSLPETTKLWKRFSKVRQAVCGALTENQSLDVNKNFKTFSWKGVDSGIHDHSGFVEGTFQGIEFDLEIKGTTVDNQPKVTEDSNGDWIITHNKEHNLGVSGNFLSADGFDGRLNIHLNEYKTSYEAYWLLFKNTKYRLEQVINQDGHVFDATKLPVDRWGKVTIPGSKVSLDQIYKK